MALSRILPVAALLAITLAQATSPRAAALVAPACSEQCTLAGLTAAQCSLTDILSCLCTNTTLLSSVSLCVQSSCNLTEQMTTATILQEQICKGVPQPSRGGEIIRATVAVTVLTYFIFTLRLISRYMVARRLWWDDWCLIAAVVVTVPMTVIPIYNASKGFGKHFWDIEPQNLRMLRLLYYVSQISYGFVQPITKISMLLLYFRIFPNKYFRLAVIISLIWMICHLLAFEGAIFFQCIPVKSIWDVSVPGKCTNFTAIIYAGAALSIFEDIVIILLPSFILKDLHLTVRKKLALSFVFTLGSFACVTSMIRLKYIVYFANSVDLTWDDVDLIIWSMIEVYTAIICASLVSIRPLIAKLFPSLFPVTKGTETNNKTAGSIPAWPSKIGTRVSARIWRANGTLLLSDDDTDGDRSEVARDNPTDRDGEIELRDRALQFETPGHSDREKGFGHRPMMSIYLR